MSKKLFSVLVVLALALSMIPVVGLPATEANAASDFNKNLSFKADGKTAYCPHCKAEVEWTELAACQPGQMRIGSVEGKQVHVYLAQDRTQTIDAQFMASSGSGTTKICLHLNGHNLTTRGQMSVGYGVGFAVMGKGKVTFLANAADADHNAQCIKSMGNTTIYGGTWKNAEGVTAYGAYVGWGDPDPVLTITGDASFASEVFCYPNVGTVVLGQNAVINKLFMNSTSKLTIDGSWTGSANMNRPNTNPTTNGKFTGDLTIYDDNTDGHIAGKYITEDGVNVTRVLASINDKTWYGSLGAAVEAYTEKDFNDGKIIKAYCAASAFTAEEDRSYYIDLNGCQGSLPTGATKRNPIVINGDGTVYLLDSANDAYDSAKCGRIALGDESYATVKDDVTVGGKRYISLKDATSGEYTAHRLTLDITDAVLRTSENGMFFKAVIKADRVLGALINAHGVVVSKTDAPTAVVEADNAFTKIDGFTANSKHTVYANSALVKNIFVDAADANNKDRSETKFYAKAYITMQKGRRTVDLFSEGVSISAADVLKTIDTKWSSYSANAKANAKAFFEQWKGKGVAGGRIEDLGLTKVK